MLAFQVQYLSGRAYACDAQNRQQVEWPPHPARFFSAMVAAFYESGLGEAEHQALEWLEEQGPPQISAGLAWRRAGVTSYVPVNDKASLFAKKAKQPRFFPSATISSADSAVFFIWPSAEPARHVHALNRIADCVTYLGSSVSLVRVRICETPPEPTLVPDQDGNLALRIFTRGRLQELESMYERRQRPSVGRWMAYRSTHIATEEQIHEEGAFGDCYVFKLDSQTGTGWPIEAALKLTDAVRRTLLDKKFAGEDPPDLLTGYGRHPHCAYIALPFVGRKHADGHILGFAIVFPKRIELEDRRSVLRVLSSFRKEKGPQLVIPEFGKWRADFITGPPHRTALNPRTWSRPARVWSSVTPVLFDHFPKNKPGLTAQEIIAASCQYIGLPTPAEVMISRYSSLTGVEPVNKFLLRRRSEDKPRFAAHVTLFFDHQVRGPILLGTGRYFGLGLMRPMVDDSNGRRVDNESLD
jgi:CRISPR-associated protein Csb2